MSAAPVVIAWPRARFGLIVLAHCLGAMTLLSVLASAPAIRAEFDLSAVQIGLLASAYSAGMASFSLPAGRVADRIGVRAALVMAAVLLAAGAAAVASARGFGPMVAGLFLAGLGYGLVNPAAGRAIVMWYPPDWRGRLSGIKQTGVSVGGAIGSGAAILTPAIGWSAVIGGVGGVALLVGLSMLALPRDGLAAGAPPPRRMTLREEIAAIATLLRNPVLGRINGASGLMNGAQFIVWTNFSDFLRQAAAMSLPLANAWLSLLQVSSIAGRLFWGWVSDKALAGGARATLLLLGSIAVPGLLALMLVTPASAPLLAPLLAVVLGFTVVAAVGVQVALTLERAPPTQIGSAVGYNMLVTNMGGVLAPPAFGLVLDLSGNFPVAWALTSLAVVLALLLLRRV